MPPLLIAAIVVLVLVMLIIVIFCGIAAGISDDELEQRYGIRRS